LHWICWHATPYNNYLFRTLASQPDIDLHVHFVFPAIPTHPWQGISPEGFSSRCYERTLGVDRELLQLAARDRRSLFVLGGWNEPTLQVVATALACRGRPFVLWTDTPDLGARRGAVKSFARSRWLQWIFTRSMAVMGTGPPALAALRQMGCP